MAEWRSIPGWDGRYEASSDGYIRSITRSTHRPRVRALGVGTNGYATVVLFASDGSRSTKSVHVLVAAAFLGPRPAGMVVRHLDGDPLNNVAPNLAYGTQGDNMLDRVRHGNDPHVNQTHCKNGHPFDASNTYREPKTGWRSCRACNRLAVARSKARRSTLSQEEVAR